MTYRDRDVYNVCAVEPLGGLTVRVTLDIWQMRDAFQRQRGGTLSPAYERDTVQQVSRIRDGDTVQQVSRS